MQWESVQYRDLMGYSGEVDAGPGIAALAASVPKQEPVEPTEPSTAGATSEKRSSAGASEKRGSGGATEKRSSGGATSEKRSATKDTGRAPPAAKARVVRIKLEGRGVTVRQ